MGGSEAPPELMASTARQPGERWPVLHEPKLHVCEPRLAGSLRPCGLWHLFSHCRTGVNLSPPGHLPWLLVGCVQRHPAACGPSRGVPARESSMASDKPRRLDFLPEATFHSRQVILSSVSTGEAERESWDEAAGGGGGSHPLLPHHRLGPHTRHAPPGGPVDGVASQCRAGTGPCEFPLDGHPWVRLSPSKCLEGSRGHLGEALWGLI